MLVALTTTGLAITDRHLQIQRANPAAERVFRSGPGRLEGARLTDFLTTASVERLSDLLGRAGSLSNPTEPLAVTARASDGTEAPLELRVARLTGASGGEYAIAMRDLRERSALVDALADRGAELARSNAELREFAYVASHDLQEPLRMISSYTELVADRYRERLDPDATEFLTFARDGARRMQQLLDALLAYSRLDRERPPPTPVSLDGCLEDALGNLRLAISESGATVEHGELPVVEGDRFQFVELFQNLVANAIKFRTSAPPRIEITSAPGRTDATISVRDNGIGIPPQFHERIFAIFQRLHRRETYPGNGVGLAICKKIVERHGGEIWVESSGRSGEGSTFRFRLPYRLRGTATAPPELLTAPTDVYDDRRLAGELIASRLRELA